MYAISRRRLLKNSTLAAMGALDAWPPAWAQQVQDVDSATGASAGRITVGVVQQAREEELGANRDKIVRFLGRAKTAGCRLVVFPEDALGSPEGTPNEDVDKAVTAIQDAARRNDVYVIFCLAFGIPGLSAERRGQRLLVVGPNGQIIQSYNKLICNLPKSDPRRAPGVFHIDGIPCSAMICADRWLRGVEELPVTLGSRILIDCSANARAEWIPEFAWYLPVTRALRNNVFSIFCNMGEHPRGKDIRRHGHSAIIRPDGTFAARTEDAGDEMLVATLELSQAHAAEARRRSSHPVFKPYWDLGRRILSGDQAAVSLPEPYVSPKVEISIAAAQMACSRDIAANLDSMARLIGAAEEKRADVAVFPELAVTGALKDDILRADGAVLRDALTKIQAEAQRRRICVVFGMPRVDRNKRWNSAVAVGPDGALLTRYDQMVVDRHDVFQEGSDAASMWFKVKGVPAVMTVGTDARWNEIGELAALRGAQLLLNLAYDADVSAEATLRRTQFWVQLASFHTFTATVNAAHPQGIARPSATASGGSCLWEDFGGHKKSREKVADAVEVYSQYSASRIACAGREQTILCAKRAMPGQNMYLRQFVGSRYPSLMPWYHQGARVIGGDHS